MIRHTGSPKMMMNQGPLSLYPSSSTCPFYQLKGCESIYIDFLAAPKDVVRLYAATPVKRRKGPRGGVSDPFPNKLREMLSAASNEGLNDVVAWKDHGRSFGIYDPDIFVRDVLPRFFKQTKLTSFQRQLNLYGFLRVTSGPEQGCYYHPMFLQSRPDLLSIMIRDRTNPWTKLVEPNEATSCISFADIRPHFSPMTKGAVKAAPPTPMETLVEGKDCDSIVSGIGDEFIDLLDGIFDINALDAVVSHSFKTDGIAITTNDNNGEIKAVSPSSSDVDDNTDDESPTGFFAGQQFHCVNNETKVLTMEQKAPIYSL